MSSRTLHLGIVLITLVTFGVSKRGVANGKGNGDLDQLLSFTYAFNRKVRPTVEAKLIQTPASYGRMIRLPSFPEIGESAVSVDCPTVATKNSPCRVTLTRAQSSMENAFVEHLGEADPIQKVREIPTVRKEADIPVATATAFRDCLSTMIPAPGDPLELHPVNRTHSERIEFWLEEPNMPVRKGERAEYPGKRTKALINIGDRLARYVEATPSERAAITKQIEQEASRILASRESGPNNKK
jgi:hypothetical protein